MARTGFAALAACALLAGCGDQPQGEGGVTAEESEQLNEAAEMLDASPDSLAAPEETALGNGEAGSAEAGDAAVLGNAAGAGNTQ